jgi:hypothetical protein
MAIREGRWDCPTCGTVGQLGRDLGCSQCGTRRPEGIRFYLPDDAPELTDPSLLSRARAGADWVCEHCAASACAVDEACPGCGAPRGSSPAQRVTDYDLAAVPRSGAEPERRAMAAAALPATSPRRGGSWLKRGAVAMLVLLGWCFFRSKEVTATVAEKAWERSLEVEAYRTVRESDWSVPTGGRTVRSYRAVQSHRQELDHYETRTRTVTDRVQVGTRSYVCGQRDLGNGNFEDRTCTEPEYESRSRTESYQEPIYRQVPIYATKYDFDIERWVTDTVLVSRGEADDATDADAPAWPQPRMTGQRREGERKETYTLVFRDDRDRTYTREVPLAQYQAYRVGAPVEITVRGSTVLEVKTPGQAEN